MHLYKLLEILLKESIKLKNATVLFLRKKYNSVSNFCLGASKVILNDSPYNFGRYTIQLSAESNKLYNRTISNSYQI